MKSRFEATPERPENYRAISTCDECVKKLGTHDFNNACCVARYVIELWRTKNWKGPKNKLRRERSMEYWSKQYAGPISDVHRHAQRILTRE